MAQAPLHGAVAQMFRIALTISRSFFTHAALPLASLALTVATAHSQSVGSTLYLLTDTGALSTMSTAPGAEPTDPKTITGVAAGETLVAIDVRPQNQRLYGLGVNATADNATLYHISPETGLATPVGAIGAIAFTTNGSAVVDFPDPATTGWDIDFNPAVDRLRVVAGSLNFRVNPNNGTPVDGNNGGAGAVTGTNPDGPVNTGTTTVAGAAYTNNAPNNGNLTTLYTVDTVSNSLYLQNPPNAGTQSLGKTLNLDGSTLDISAVKGFDILPGVNVASSNAAVAAGTAILVASVSGGDTAIYDVDLTTGAVTKGESIALGIRSSAIRTTLSAAAALDATGTNLVRFDPSTPGTLTTVAITGIQGSDTLVGIDNRPNTGQLFALGVNATADTATLYLLDPQTGAATTIGAAGSIAFVDGTGNPVDLPPASTGYGFDFNPTVDRIRVVTGSGLNFRLNPTNGAAVDGNAGAAGTNPDGALNGASTKATGTAYTNSFGQAAGGMTTQYSFDSSTGKLYIQNPPNNGTLVTELPVVNGDLGPAGGFDIPASVKVPTSGSLADGSGYILAGQAGAATLYRVNLKTGQAATLGLLGTGATASGLVVWATAPDVRVLDDQNNTLQTTGSTVSFGTIADGNPVTKEIVVQNVGSQPLTIDPENNGSSSFAIVTTASSVPGDTSVKVQISYTPSATGTETGNLVLTSDDVDSPTYTIALSGPGLVPLAADKAVSVGGKTRIYPLANDEFGAGSVITAVSNAAVQIDGRTLIIPANFVGTFTYTVSNGTQIGQGTVTVTAGTAVMNPKTFTGLLKDQDENIVGSGKATISAAGAATVQIRAGKLVVSAKLSAPTVVNIPTTTYTTLGNLFLTKLATGEYTLALDALGGDVGAVLRATKTSATAEKHHIALASISPNALGGGYAIAMVNARGAVTIKGILPDGLPFSSATAVRDDGSIAFYTAVTSGAKPPAFLGGELVVADLTATDVTGELAYLKFPQLTGAKGTHLGGLDTTITANGSKYTGAPLFSGTGTLNVAGGNLAASENSAVTVTKGIPELPAGSAVKAWTGVSAKTGKFSVKVQIPGITKPVTGGGLYLPKSQRAWGYFPGTTVGGRIDLSVQ